MFWLVLGHGDPVTALFFVPPLLKFVVSLKTKTKGFGKDNWLLLRVRRLSVLPFGSEAGSQKPLSLGLLFYETQV